MITGIVVALPEEISTLTDKKLDKGHCVFIAKHIMLVYSGAGWQNAHTAAELLVAKGATHLISWGCAAGLDADLHSGDLILPDTLMDIQGSRIPANISWHQHCQKILAPAHKVHTGCLLTADQLITMSKDKKQLNLKTGAIALDMESMAITQVAHQHNLPFLAIRTIADPVNTSLPLAVKHALNDQGEVELKKLLLGLALRPYELPRLINLALHFRAAKKTLQRVAKQLNSIIQPALSGRTHELRNVE